MNRDSFIRSKWYVASILSSLPLLLTGCVTSKQAPVSPAPVAQPLVEKPLSPPPQEMAAPVAMDPMDESSRKLQFDAVGIAFLESENGMPDAVEAEAFIHAEGVGLPVEGDDPVQKRITALEAARYRALANLAEKLHGQEVTREAKVVDMAFAGEEVHVSLSGELKGVSEVSRNYDEETGVATVVLGVALDPSGNASPAAPPKKLSIGQRKSRAEAAARIHAAALLREQVGKFFVEQNVCVENLALKHQDARVYVQGLLKGAHYSSPRWPNAEKCEVTASLEVGAAELAQLAEEPTAIPPEAAPVEGE